jgi:hypothetical protein
MHPLLMPLVAASLLGSPVLTRGLAEVSIAQVQPHVLTTTLDFRTAEAKPVELELPTDRIQPKWTGKVAGLDMALIPKKPSGGFEIDLEIKW